MANMKEMRNTYRVFAGKPEIRDESLGIPRRRCEVSIKIDLGEMVLEDMDWVHLAHDRGLYLDIVNTIMKLRVS